MILLTKFAESRGERGDTVRKYISRHKEAFEGHIDTDGKQMLLDDEAVKLLEEIYPLPKPVEVVEDTESRKKLIDALERLEKAKDTILTLNNRCSELEMRRLESETELLLLEEKNKHEIEQSRYEIEMLRSSEALKITRIEQLEAELEAEKSRSLSLGEALKRVFSK